MYRKILEAIASERANGSEQLQPPGQPEALQQLQSLTQSVLAAEIPSEYREFLSITNGLDWNGLVIYASATTPLVGCEGQFIQGIVEANFLWRDYPPNQDFLIFGESGLSKYVYHLAQSQYQVLDRHSMEVVKSVATFDELLTEALTHHL